MSAEPVAGTGPRDFDPVALGSLECDAWAAYYRHEWVTFLRAAVGMVRVGFGMSRRRTLLGAWHVLRANQVWSPVPDNDPDAAREHMIRFYRLVARSGWAGFDPARAAALEVEWWRVHRVNQRGPSAVAASGSWLVDRVPQSGLDGLDGGGGGGADVGGAAGAGSVDTPREEGGAGRVDEDVLIEALVALYAHIYDLPRDVVGDPARLRVEAMDASDAWVDAGCDLEHPLLSTERRLLVESYTALREAIDRT